MKEADVAKILHSRGVTAVMALLTAGGAWLAYSLGHVADIPWDRGTVLPSANLWIGNAEAAMAVNVALTLCAAIGMLLLSRTFNLMRTVSQLDATLFLAMSLAVPDLLCTMYTGTPLLLTLLVCLFLLYSTFSEPSATPRVFLVFLLLSLGTMTQYCYAVYIPVFFIALGQMRIFSLRTVLAAVLGLLTPWWIGLGLGLTDFSRMHWPEFVPLTSIADFGDAMYLMAVMALSAGLLIAGWCLNFMKMLSYNAHLRAYSGTLSLLSLFTIIAAVADFPNASSYAPTLFMLSALELCMLFVNRRKGHTAAATGAVIAVYLLLYVWDVIF